MRLPAAWLVATLLFATPSYGFSVDVGDVIVAAGTEVVKVDPDTGVVTAISSGFFGAQDAIVVPGGDLYVVSQGFVIRVDRTTGVKMGASVPVEKGPRDLPMLAIDHYTAGKAVVGGSSESRSTKSIIFEVDLETLATKTIAKSALPFDDVAGHPSGRFGWTAGDTGDQGLIVPGGIIACCDVSRGITFSPSGQALVGFQPLGSNPATIREIDFGTYPILADGGFLSLPGAMTFDGAGNLVVLDSGSLFSIDVATGEQTLITEVAGSSVDVVGAIPEPGAALLFLLALGLAQRRLLRAP